MNITNVALAANWKKIVLKLKRKWSLIEILKTNKILLS